MREAFRLDLLVWQTYLLAALCGIYGVCWPLPAGTGLFLLLCFNKKLRKPGHFVITFIIVAVAFGYVQWQFQKAYEQLADPPEWLNSKSSRFCATISSVQGLPDQRLRLILSDIHLPEQPPLAGLAAWTWEEPQYQPIAGQKVCLARQLRPVGGFANYEVDTWAIRDVARGIYWRAWSKGNAGQPEFSGTPFLPALVRQQVMAKFIETLGSDLSQGKAILLALLFGDRFYLSSNTVNLFARATLAHSLALSGQHLGIVWLMGFQLVLLMGLPWPGIFLYKPRSLLVFAVSLPLSLLYLWLGDAPSSLIRATVMLCLLGVWQWRSTCFNPLDLLCATLAIILLANPLLAFDTGLQLSILCVGVIVLFWPAISSAGQHIPGKFPCRRIARQLVVICLISLAIQLALLPLNLLLFDQAGLWFFLNAVWLPCLALISLPGAVSGLLVELCPLEICQHISGFILDAASWPGTALLRLLTWLNEQSLLSEPLYLIPPWQMLFAFGMIICGLVAITRQSPARTRKFFIAALLFLLAGSSMRLKPQEHITVEALDIGQGQCLLLSLPDGKRLLIDGGGSTSPRFDPGRAILLPYLSRNHPPELTTVINSHPDLDHLGGLFEPIRRMSPQLIFHNGREGAKSLAGQWTHILHDYRNGVLKAGDQILLDDEARLEVLHPSQDDWLLHGNDASLVIRLVWRDRGLMLFTGDVGREGIGKILQSGQNIQADLVIAPHHGSDKNLVRELYLKAGPKLVIANCGRNNRWHYPGQKLQDFLATRHMPLYDTGNSGRITVRFYPAGEIILESVRK